MYRVLLIDNFAAPGDGASSDGPAFDTLDEAVAYCKRVVDDFLEGEICRGVHPGSLWDQYATFGEDPLVLSPDFGDSPFSGWDYARSRCQELQHPERCPCPLSSLTMSPAGSKPDSATTSMTTSTWTYTSPGTTL